MKIDPNAPWYPSPFKKHDVYEGGTAVVVCDKCAHGVPGGCPACLGVPIRLKLAAMAMQGIVGNSAIGFTANLEIGECAFKMADAMIARANRDEETGDGK